MGPENYEHSGIMFAIATEWWLNEKQWRHCWWSPSSPRVPKRKWSVKDCLNLGHVEENFVSVPFYVILCALLFVHRVMLFYLWNCVWMFVCVSSPLRTRWGRVWCPRPPQPAPDSPTTQAAPTTPPPTPTWSPHPIHRPLSSGGHRAWKQPGNMTWFIKTVLTQHPSDW